MQYRRVWYNNLFGAKCVLWKSVIQWSLCSKVYSIEEYDTVINVQQSIVYGSVWYSDIFVAVYNIVGCATVVYVQQSILYGKVWYINLYVAHYAVYNSAIQWYICSTLGSIEECDTVIYM
jgi:hypothetical protein